MCLGELEWKKTEAVNRPSRAPCRWEKMSQNIWGDVGTQENSINKYAHISLWMAYGILYATFGTSFFDGFCPLCFW